MRTFSIPGSSTSIRRKRSIRETRRVLRQESRAKELLTGKRVRIELDPTQDTRDKYGRLLVNVYRDDGLVFNLYMIEQGYAHEYIYAVPYEYQSPFNAAQDNRRGLGSPNTCNAFRFGA